MKNFNHRQTFGTIVHIARALIAMELYRIQAQTRGQSSNGTGLPIHENANGANERRQLAPDLPRIGGETARGSSHRN